MEARRVSYGVRMAIAIIKSIIRLFISLSYVCPYYIFLIVDERLTALNRNVALIIVGMMMIALFGHLVGFTLQPVGSLKRNSTCLLYTSPSPRDKRQSRMPSSA